MEPDGLRDALVELSESAETLHHVPCRLDTQDEVVVSDLAAATHLYFIAKEALHNAVKHSGTDRVLIRLYELDGRIWLEIRDNGTGIQPSATPPTGRGSRIMKHRAAIMGAVLEFRPSPGGGTSVICHIDKLSISPNGITP